MSSESDEADKPTSGFGGDNKSLRKLRKKETKEKQRANRQHDPKAVDLHRKTCDDCQNPKDVLIRCQADDSGRWYMLCTAGCWQKASGGQVDGSSSTPHYLYGGIWKNRHADVTGNLPSTVASKYKKERLYEVGTRYSVNDQVIIEGIKYICRASHTASEADKGPLEDHHRWRES